MLSAMGMTVFYRLEEGLFAASWQVKYSCNRPKVSVRVTTMDAELEFAIQSNTTGKQLFDQ
ncbi:Moesin, partial [Trichinella nativa]